MVAQFILSFDCEGKWGVADHLTAQDQQSLSEKNLRWAYQQTLCLLDKYQIPATFAFVGCFSLTSRELKEIEPEFKKLADIFPHYLGVTYEHCFKRAADGWIGDWAVNMVQSSSLAHELALHSMTHIPWDDPNMSESIARQELFLLDQFNNEVISQSKTYIYPRNAVAYPHLLKDRNILGYRIARPRTSRIRSLAHEFNIFNQPEQCDNRSQVLPLKIPAGYFVNWQHGLRRSVPIKLTQFRARNLLKKAAQQSATVHYRLHPENIASAPQTLNALSAILHEVHVLRERGECVILTQHDYCKEAIR